VSEGSATVLLAFEGVDGAGKTSLLRGCAAELGSRARVLETKLAYELVALFQSLFDAPSGEEGAYQDALPPDFRHSAYIVEAILQMKREADHYAEYDFVLFDRWLQTHWVYLESPRAHAEWYALLERYVPKPLLTVYVRVEPKLALKRLVRKDDWMVARRGKAQLLVYLEELTARYDEAFANCPRALVVDGAEPRAALCEAVVSRLEGLRVPD
jgi:thymidylate kinase